MLKLPTRTGFCIGGLDDSFRSTRRRCLSIRMVIKGDEMTVPAGHGASMILGLVTASVGAIG